MIGAENTIGNNRQAILIADDDEMCLEVGAKMLQKLGYSVFKAKDGLEAIDIFSKNQDTIGLVILDMKMPHNGSTVFYSLKKINPTLKVIIISGFVEEKQIQDLIRDDCQGFIQKPFKIDTLRENVISAVGGRT